MDIAPCVRVLTCVQYPFSLRSPHRQRCLLCTCQRYGYCSPYMRADASARFITLPQGGKYLERKRAAKEQALNKGVDSVVVVETA